VKPRTLEVAFFGTPSRDAFSCIYACSSRRDIVFQLGRLSSSHRFFEAALDFAQAQSRRKNTVPKLGSALGRNRFLPLRDLRLLRPRIIKRIAFDKQRVRPRFPIVHRDHMKRQRCWVPGTDRDGDRHFGRPLFAYSSLKKRDHVSGPHLMMALGEA